jgi:hypothetical protein
VSKPSSTCVGMVAADVVLHADAVGTTLWRVLSPKACW